MKFAFRILNIITHNAILQHLLAQINPTCNILQQHLSNLALLQTLDKLLLKSLPSLLMVLLHTLRQDSIGLLGVELKGVTGPGEEYVRIVDFVSDVEQDSVRF